MTQVDRRQETPRRGPRRRLAIGLAAAAAVVLSAAVLLLALNDDEPVAATTTTPSESSALEVSGQGSQNSHTLELSGSYSVETTVTGDCSYTFELSRSGTGHLVSAITSIADPGTTTVTLNDISSGNYFVTVQTDTEFSCPWTMEFTR